MKTALHALGLIAIIALVVVILVMFLKTSNVNPRVPLVLQVFKELV